MKVSELFDVEYPHTLIYTELPRYPEEINFVSSQGGNNSVVSKVAIVPGVKIYPAGVITVPLKGTVLAAHVQKERCYVAHQIAVLTAKKLLSMQEKLYYCMCIQSNAYRFSYGRQADRTLKEMELPDSVPEWVNGIPISPITTRQTEPAAIASRLWSEYRMGDLFRFVKGRRLTKADMIDGPINYLGAISENNGVRQHIEVAPEDTSAANCITVNYNGSVGEAFYQSEPFWASDDVNILYADGWAMNKYNALFIVTVIKANRYRFSYGRKWTMDKMKESIIKLPSKADGSPDYEYMEAYIKTLPYSDRI